MCVLDSLVVVAVNCGVVYYSRFFSGCSSSVVVMYYSLLFQLSIAGVVVGA